MVYEIRGDLVKGKEYDCSIVDFDGHKYLGVVVSKKWEIMIFHNNEQLYASEYCCDSVFQKIFSCGYYRFTDRKDNELFTLYKAGLLKLTTMLRFEGKSYKLRRKYSYTIAQLGFEMKISGTKFVSTITEKKNRQLGILLSYFCWLSQQRFDRMD